MLAMLDAGQREYYCAGWLWRGGAETAEELLSPCSLNVESVIERLTEISAGKRVTCVGQGVPALWGNLIDLAGVELLRPAARLDLPDAAFLGELVLAAPERYRVGDIYAFEPAYIRTGQAQLRLGK